MIRREVYMKQIRPFIGTDLIKVLTGIRRCGKSVMLELIQNELAASGVPYGQFLAYNFEQMKHARLRTADALYAELRERIERLDGRVFLFFDEIQEVEGWERCVNSCRVDFNCDIFITGSNARLLSGELATHLAGRYAEIPIYPFSFSEFLDARRTIAPDVATHRAFADYLQFGGMPFLATFSGDREAAAQYLQDVYASVVLRDVVQRHKIRNVELLERIVRYALANVGRPFSASSVSKYFKSERRNVATETVLNYLDACRDAYLLYKAPREDLHGKRILAVNEKYYVADHALRDALYGQNALDIDQALENIVYLELRRRGYSVNVGTLRDGREVDLVATRGSERLYIQVAYLLASPETLERVFRPFDAIPDHYPRLVLSLDEFDRSRDGVRHMDLREFLLRDAEPANYF